MSFTIKFETVELAPNEWPLLVVTACLQDGDEFAVAEVFVVDPEDEPVAADQFRLPGADAKSVLLEVARLATIEAIRKRPRATNGLPFQIVEVSQDWVRAATALSKYRGLARVKKNTDYDELSTAVKSVEVKGLWRSPIG